MADTSLKVTVTDILPEFFKLLKGVDATRVFPNVLAAVKILAADYTEQWRRFTMGDPIPGTPRRIYSRGPYTKSIQMEDIGPHTAAAASTGPWTDWIEKGHPEIDLKPGMLSGPKARMSQEGLPYNIIPFRHGTPNTLPSNKPMPINVYTIMKTETAKADQAFKAGRSPKTGTSSVTGVGPGTIQRASGQVDLARNYQWGYKLPPSLGGPAETKKTSKGDYTWKSGKYAGMVRMAASTSRAKSSTYITFRVVSAKSDPASWIQPAQEALPIRQAVIDTMADYTREMLKAALEMDLNGGGKV